MKDRVLEKDVQERMLSAEKIIVKIEGRRLVYSLIRLTKASKCQLVFLWFYGRLILQVLFIVG